jgi:hypothetical protein
VEKHETDYLALFGAELSFYLTNPYLVALIVPVGFYFIGAFGKKLIRESQPGDHFFKMNDWYLAPDAALANVGVGIAECVDLVSRFDPVLHNGRIRATLVFIAVAFMVYLLTLALHKHYERPSVAKWKKCVWLLGFTNIVSFATMFVFLLAIRGV